MKIMNGHEVREPGYYWHVLESGEGCPVQVFSNGGGFKCLKPGDTRVYDLAGMYIGPMTTAAVQGI
ncbi:MAG TPA: hypothetical protein VEC35_09350 [Noviherbaspirillum sp.]|nr:hypothetical protein [Noviherbaspirillum sp.]